MQLYLTVIMLITLLWTSESTDANILNSIISWMRPVQHVWNNIISRLLRFQRLGQKSVCYEFIGCFHIQGSFSHLRQVPDHPQIVQTEVWICTRRFPNPVNSKSQLLSYNSSLKDSVYEPELSVKVLVHGFHGCFNSTEFITTKNAILNASNVNLVLVNWQKGAAGQYRRAVSNAELVGRQAGKILISMIAQGTNPADIHVIGFSLGAQIAGFIGETLKENGFRLGKITGLDPAGHLFESRILPAYRRLDHTDADYVEVIHTDGNRIWADGFGILRPVGHVDYFPNGGFDQPGCHNSFVDALAFSLNSNKSRACSHGRALEIFIELLTSPNCQFVGFSCPGLQNFKRDFVHGNCFRSCKGSVSTCGIIGQEGTAQGPLYLVTRSSRPYCGQQLRATVVVSPNNEITRGIIRLRLYHGNTFTDFTIRLWLAYVLGGNMEMSVVAAAEAGSVSAELTPKLKAKITFIPSPGMSQVEGPQHLFLNVISISDHQGNRWAYSRDNMLLESKLSTFPASRMVELTLDTSDK